MAVAGHDPRGDARAARAHHRGGRRRIPALPRRRPFRLIAEAAILRRRRVRPSPPAGRPRTRCCPTLLHRARRYPLHRQAAPAKMPCHWPRPKRPRRRSSRAVLQRMALTPRRSHLAPFRRRSRQLPCHLMVERQAPRRDHRRTSPAILRTAHDGRRYAAPSPRLSGAISGNATKDAAVIAIRSPVAAAPRPICCRSTTCCRSPRAAARSRTISNWRALLITAGATDRLRRRSRCSATPTGGAAPVRRRSPPLDSAGRRLAGGPAGHPSHRREPSSG